MKFIKKGKGYFLFWKRERKIKIRISIFSKFDMAGGSEFRCVELANSIGNYTEHEAYLLSEKQLPQKLHPYINNFVSVVENCFEKPECFYETDVLLIVNTDAKEFSTVDYWLGKSPRHNKSIDLKKMSGKTMCFLYNFLVSPSRHLNQFYDYDINLKIITTNNKFFTEITKQDRYEDVRIIPRYILESPIDPNRIDTFVRNPKDKVCFGMHSKSLGNKWNDELYKLINDINKRYGEGKVQFRFMGVKGNLRQKIVYIKNVKAMKEDKESVREFLNKIDVFLFFPDWKREEPWARVIAEAMVSGCPIIALNKGGTPDQVLNYNNGILCKDYKDYYKAVIKLVEHKEMISQMSNNSIRISKNFYGKSIANKLMSILEN